MKPYRFHELPNPSPYFSHKVQCLELHRTTDVEHGGEHPSNFMVFRKIWCGTSRCQPRRDTEHKGAEEQHCHSHLPRTYFPTICGQQRGQFLLKTQASAYIQKYQPAHLMSVYGNLPTPFQELFRLYPEWHQLPCISAVAGIALQHPLLLRRDQRELWAHKVALVSGSPYFKTLFEWSSRQQTGVDRECHPLGGHEPNGTIEDITVADVEPQIFYMLLSSLYGVRPEVQYDNVFDVLMAASRYRCEDLLQVCRNEVI